MIDALIAGRLHRKVQRRMSKNDHGYVTAKVRTPMTNGESAYVNVIAFSESAMTTLLALDEGHSIALAGDLTVSTYTAKNGDVRPSLNLTANAALTEYHVTRKRQAMRGEAEMRATGADPGCTSETT
jgi:single-stranded DNA-binding protein